MAKALAIPAEMTSERATSTLKDGRALRERKVAEQVGDRKGVAAGVCQEESAMSGHAGAIAIDSARGSGGTRGSPFQ